MPVANCSLGAAAVAAIYLIYSAYGDYLRARYRRELVLRERVAYMLWKAAGRVRRRRARQFAD